MHRSFYALGVGLGFVTDMITVHHANGTQGFYALGVGLGFVTVLVAP